jgi:hypothetical protein
MTRIYSDAVDSYVHARLGLERSRTGENILLRVASFESRVSSLKPETRNPRPATRDGRPGPL